MPRNRAGRGARASSLLGFGRMVCEKAGCAVSKTVKRAMAFLFMGPRPVAAHPVPICALPPRLLPVRQGPQFWPISALITIADDANEEHTSELQSHSFISYAV